jgi:8-oxo-dGTP pyrophosphatase MutT (NUDIX family)
MIQKVQAFMVRSRDYQNEICVFWSDVAQSHQLVRGTVEHAEDPETAVLREIEEESGLHRLSIEMKLGERTLLVRGGPDRTGPFEEQLHHAFLLRVNQPTVDTWTHIAQGSEEERGLAFQFSWLAINETLEAKIFDDFKPFIPELLRALHSARS